MVTLRKYLCCPDNTLDPIQYLSMCILHLSCHEALADLGGGCARRTPSHLPGILVFDDILGHIV